MRVPSSRSPVTVLLLTLITCGIYYLFWVYQTSKDVDDFLGETDIPPIAHVLLFIISGTLYGFFWDYWIAQKLIKMQRRVGVPEKDNTVLYLALDILGAGPVAGLGIVVPLLQQSDLNAVYAAAGTSYGARS
jgi:hypothetical protein